MTKALICVVVPLLVLWLPMNQVLQGIDVVQVRMLAIFTLAGEELRLAVLVAEGCGSDCPCCFGPGEG